MAKIHLYLRTQITTDDPAPIVAAVAALKQAVDAAGGDWRGGVTVDPEAPTGIVDGPAAAVDDPAVDPPLEN